VAGEQFDDANPFGDGERRLDVHAEPPPRWAVLSAAELLRKALDPDNGVGLRFRRRQGAQPVLRVTDKYLTGVLDLRAVEFPYLLEFVRCRFQQPPDLRQATLAGVEFTGCLLPGLAARNVYSRNDISLLDCTVRGGPVDLTDARVKGSLVLNDSRLAHPGQRALHADRLELSGALLGHNLEVVGELRIAGLRAGGNVNLSGAGLHNPDGYALDGNGLHVGGNLVCGTDGASGRRFTTSGCLFLPSARIDSDVSLRGARLHPGSPDRTAQPSDDPYYDPRAVLIADRIRVDGNVDCDQGLTSAGTLRVVNAQIGGSLRLTGAEIDVAVAGTLPSGDVPALHFDGTEVRGDVDARGLRVAGQTSLVDVTVRGSVHLDGACLDNPGEDVFVARRLAVGSTVECRDADIYGSVIMQGARIGANLDLRASTITRPGRYTRDRNTKPCLDIRATQIGRDLICASGARPFTSAGEIRMHRAEIGREINFSGSVIGDEGVTTALNAFGASTQELVLTFRKPPAGRVNLRHVHCASLNDNAGLWSAAGGLVLDGFRYDALAQPIPLKDDARLAERLDWLRSATGGSYSPGPYDQFAAMLRAAGNEEHAATVLMTKQRDRYAALAKGFRVLGPPVLLWSWLQRWMVGYGYRPVRALGWLLVLLLAGTLYFWLAPLSCADHPAPGDPSTFAQYPLCPVTNQDTHLWWNPVVYTLDLLIPIVDFGNKNRWSMTGVTQWVGATLEVAGYILATTVAAGITRILRRN
jgi:hypothetical protein